MVLRQWVGWCALVAALLVFQNVSAQENIDDGDFENGNAQAPNQDSDQVPGLALHQPTYGGSGCPQGSISAAMSPDQRELSVLFDNYVIRAGGATGQRAARANCKINLKFGVPSGYQAQIVKIDYRGFQSIPSGAFGRFTATLGYEEWTGRRMPLRRFARSTNFRGPVQNNFQLSSVLRGPAFSPCGQPFTLSAESMVQVTSNASNEEAIFSIDSLDAVTQPVKLSLRWKRCSPDGGPGGGHGGGDFGRGHGGGDFGRGHGGGDFGRGHGGGDFGRGHGGGDFGRGHGGGPGGRGHGGFEPPRPPPPPPVRPILLRPPPPPAPPPRFCPRGNCR